MKVIWKFLDLTCKKYKNINNFIIKNSLNYKIVLKGRIDWVTNSFGQRT